MTHANTHGWEILAPHDIELIWDGVYNSEPNHVKVLKGEYFENGSKFLHTGVANGTITFDLKATFETDENHYVLLMPPANLFIDGVKPMTALLRSDWYHSTSVQISWMMTTKDKIVTIPKGTPLVLIMNYPKNLLEETKVTIQQATEEEIEALHEYGRAREEHYKNNSGFNWTHWYRDGKDGPNSESVYEKPYKPRPSDPRKNNE